jgi:hypothetical protein
MLYRVNLQQWFNIESIESIDDFGYDVGVKLKSGRDYRIHGSNRDEFFAAALREPNEEEKRSGE